MEYGVICTTKTYSQNVNLVELGDKRHPNPEKEADNFCRLAPGFIEMFKILIVQFCKLLFQDLT